MKVEKEIKELYDKYAIAAKNQIANIGDLHKNISPVMRYYRNRKVQTAVTLANFKKGSKIKNLFAVVGPSITEKNYEVQKDFKYRFIKKDKKSNNLFKTRKNKTYYRINNNIYNK